MVSVFPLPGQLVEKTVSRRMAEGIDSRFGQMLCNGGVGNGQRIVPVEWIDDTLDANPDIFSINLLAAESNTDLIYEQCKSYSPKYVYLKDTRI